MAAYPDIDDVFRALADPSRRRLLDRLNGRNGQTLRELCTGLDMARQSVSKHLGVLEAAGLVTTVRRGREKLHYLNAAPINELGERWITATTATASTRSPTSNTHWRTPPWTARRSSTRPTSAPRPSSSGAPSPTPSSPGATGARRSRPTGRRARPCAGTSSGSRSPTPGRWCSRPTRSGGSPYTWHTFTPELAQALELTEDAARRLADEPRSKVTFELEPLGELVKLTVVHDGFEPGSIVASMVGQGWPRILSSLKTLLETGETLPPDDEPRPTVRLGLTTRGGQGRS